MEPTMQRQPGQYGDILRVIGRLLDEREKLEAEAVHPAESDDEAAIELPLIRDMEIVEREAFTTVYWKSRGTIQSESYTDPILAQLRKEARGLRGKTTGDRHSDRADLLRTLGEELDARGLSYNGIAERDEEFVVSGIEDGRYVTWSYPHEDLRALNGQRQPQRAAPAADPAAPEPRAFHWRFFWRRTQP